MTRNEIGNIETRPGKQKHGPEIKPEKTWPRIWTSLYIAD